MQNEGGILLYVTEFNHEWIAEASGLSLEEIEKRYRDSRSRDEICVIRTEKSFAEIQAIADKWFQGRA